MACNTRGIIKIPMFIDTYRKDDFNEPELDRTAKFIFDTLKSKHQAFVLCRIMSKISIQLKAIITQDLIYQRQTGY